MEYHVNGGVALYGAYAADFNVDSSALRDAGVDCSTTWDGSEFQSPTVWTAKEWRNACVEEPTARNLNWCFALILSSATTRPTCSGSGITTAPADPARAGGPLCQRQNNFFSWHSCRLCIVVLMDAAQFTSNCSIAGRVALWPCFAAFAGRPRICSYATVFRLDTNR